MPVPNQSLPNIAGKPSIVTRSSEVIWLPAWKTSNGTPIRTSGNKLPILPLMEPVAVAVFHIFKFKSYSDDQFRNEINSINSGEWRGWSEGQAWISKIISNGREDVGSVGEVVHYVVRCIDRDDGWDVLYPEVGFMDSTYTLPVSILNKTTKRKINFNSIHGLSD